MSPAPNKSHLKLPRSIEGDARLPQLLAILEKIRKPLWEKSALKVSEVTLTPCFEKTLFHLQVLYQLERGLENIDKILSHEKRGIDALNAKQGTAPIKRISRLLIISEDASERFNRGCERLLLEHQDRLLGLRINVTESKLIEKLYGPDTLAKVLLISHKEAVATALWSLLG